MRQNATIITDKTGRRALILKGKTNYHGHEMADDVKWDSDWKTISDAQHQALCGQARKCLKVEYDHTASLRYGQAIWCKERENGKENS